MEAIQAYGRLASVKTEEEEDCWVLHFSDCVYGEARTMKEFENYLIGLENS